MPAQSLAPGQPRRASASRTAALACLLALHAATAGAAIGTGPGGADAFDDLRSLSLDELMNIDVSTASRRAEPLLRTPAAVYVITRDEIRRSGARTLPEALRLAPGVEVARRSSHSWAITMRGFNGELSNKLLVLVDGRSVYSPLYAGVFWDVQDYLLEDIDRIEVVGGPGGTLWGANAVNGVINIITRSATDSTGTYLEAGAGDEERLYGGARVGGRVGDTGWARAYVSAFDRDASERATTGADGVDDSRMLRGGFRADWALGADTLTVQGDLYDGEEGARTSRSFTLGTLPTGSLVADTDVSGANMLGRWTRHAGTEREAALQVYFDRTERDIPNTYAESRNTFDVDFQQRMVPGTRHDVLWGAGVRYTRDEIDNTIFATFIPASRDDWTLSGFVQDRIGFAGGRVLLTPGVKLEHNDYTGYEVQPNLRVAVLVSPEQTAWAAVSRAVRIPSRLDADLQLTVPLAIPGVPVPVYARVSGSDDFGPEELLAWEAGWRLAAGEAVSVDITAFYHEYENLQTTEPREPVIVEDPPYILLPNVLTNGADARARGATLATRWQPGTDWQLQLDYTWLDLRATPQAGARDPTVEDVEGRSPKHQVGFHAYVDLPRDLHAYAGLRYVDELPARGVGDYFALDANLAWRASAALELSLAGRNLLEETHAEFDAANLVERSVWAQAAWRY